MGISEPCLGYTDVYLTFVYGDLFWSSAYHNNRVKKHWITDEHLETHPYVLKDRGCESEI